MGGLQKKDLLLDEEVRRRGEEIPTTPAMRSQNPSGSDSEKALNEPSKSAIYNGEALLEKLESIARPENAEGLHRLADDHDDPPEAIDVNDDLARELAFYTQDLDGTRQASFRKLRSVGLRRDGEKEGFCRTRRGSRSRRRGRRRGRRRRLRRRSGHRRPRSGPSGRKRSSSLSRSGGSRGSRAGFCQGGRGMMRWIWVLMRRRDSRNRIRGCPGWLPAIDPVGDGRKRGQEKNKKSRERRNSKFGHGGRKGTGKQNTADTTNNLRGFNMGDMPMNKKRKR